MKKRIPIIAIVGPTGVGKTDISVKIALILNSEIINVDSRQIYKFMNIGTAKPSSKILSLVKHHLIDIIYPDEYFSAGKYGTKARKVIFSLFQKDMIPLLVGGSGLYLSAIIYGLFEGPQADHKLRKTFTEYANHFGKESLHTRLKKIDPESANRIHPMDIMRVIRALEVYEKTGKPISYFQVNFSLEEIFYIPIIIGLERDRKDLYKRIESRVDLMIGEGLVDEVKRLLDMGYSEELHSMMGIGYKQTISFLKGKHDLDKAISLIKRDTKRYAKRQITWFKKVENIKWINLTDNLEEDVNTILDFINTNLDRIKLKKIKKL